MVPIKDNTNNQLWSESLKFSVILYDIPFLTYGLWQCYAQNRSKAKKILDRDRPKAVDRFASACAHSPLLHMSVVLPSGKTYLHRAPGLL